MRCPCEFSHEHVPFQADDNAQLHKIRDMQKDHPQRLALIHVCDMIDATSSRAKVGVDLIAANICDH